MKRVLLLLLMCVGFSALSYGATVITKTKQYVGTVGVPFVIDPIVDIGFTHADLYNMSGLLQLYYDDRNYSPTDFIYTSTIYTGYSSSYRGEWYTVTPQNAGTSTFHIKIRNTYVEHNQNGTFQHVDEYDIQYTIYIVDVTNISIPANLSFGIGEEYTFLPVITHNLAEATLTWRSNDTTVATVDDSGKLTTINAGTTTITCTAQNGVSAQCEVTVNPILANSITLNESDVELKVGNRLQLEATVMPENATDKSVTWSSTNENVAWVNEIGKVFAVGTGFCQIKATANDGSGKFASCFIEVTEAGSVPSSVPGDMNGDGKVTIEDAVKVIDIILEKQ